MKNSKLLKQIFENNILPKINRAQKLARRKKKLIGYPLMTYKLLEDKLDGIQSGFYLWAGISQSSKTMNMANLCPELLDSNEDLHIIYYSIDDDFNTIYYRMLARESQISINDVALIERYISKMEEEGLATRDSILKWYHECETKVKEKMKRIFVFDSTDTIYIEDMISKVNEVYQTTVTLDDDGQALESNLVVLIDNFHLLEFKAKDKQGFSEKVKVTEMSHVVKKDLVVKFDIPVHATAELRKLNHVGVPDLDALKESVALRYDANVVFLIHNDTVSKLGETILYWYRKPDNEIGLAIDWVNGLLGLPDNEKINRFESAKETGKFMPIILLIIAKNKLSGFEGKLFYALDSHKATIYEIPEKLQRKLRKIPIQYLSEQEKEAKNKR